MDKKAKALKIIQELEKVYPEAYCELDFGTDFELLVSVILSAQCTDKRVNQVTEKLFKVANTPEAFASMENEQLEKLIFSCGFYRMKAKNIINMSRDLLLKFGGEVPSTMEELVTLAGVGRKTANVMLAVAFNKEAFAVDTHVFRVSRRLGLSFGKTPYDVEKDVTGILGGKDLANAHHLFIFHGRYCCKSQNPMCAACSITEYCEYVKEKERAAE